MTKTMFSIKQLLKAYWYTLRMTNAKGRILILTSTSVMLLFIYLGSLTIWNAAVTRYNALADTFAVSRVQNSSSLKEAFVTTKEVPVINAEAASAIQEKAVQAVSDAAKDGASSGAKSTVESYLTSPKVK